MRRLTVIAFALLIMTAPAFAAVNLLTNGDFETGPFGSNGTVTNWTVWSQSTSSASNYNRNTADNSSLARSGSGAYSVSSKTGVATGIVFANLGCYQTVTVTAGKTYKVDGWLDGYGDTSGLSQYLFEVGVINGAWDQSTVNGSNNTLTAGTSAVTSLSALTTPTPNTYVQVSSNILPAKSNLITATGTQLTVYIRAGAKMSNTGNKIRMRADDMSLELVPEPGSLLALLTALVGIGGIARRRKA